MMKKKLSDLAMKKWLWSLVGIVVAIIIAVYVLWWYNANTVKKVITSFIQENEYISYSTAKISGFPLQKKIVLRDVSFKFGVLTPEETKINVSKVEVTSSLFSSRKYVINVGKVITAGNKENGGYIQFDKNPYIVFSLNNKGKLRSFSYRDEGYRVISQDEEVLYGAGSSSVGIENMEESGYIGNRIIFDFQKLQNLYDLGLNDSVPVRDFASMPAVSHNISGNVEMLTKSNGLQAPSVMRVKYFKLTNDLYEINVSGSVEGTVQAPSQNINLLAKINNYESFAKEVSTKIVELAEAQFEIARNKPSVSEQELSTIVLYHSRAKNIAAEFPIIFKEVSAKNPDSIGNVALLEFKRENGEILYVNDEPVQDIINKVIAARK